MEKLGIKAGHRVTLDGIDDADVDAELEAVGADVSRGRQRKDSDVIISSAKSIADLAKLEKLRGYIKDEGMIWVVWPKGKKELREDDVRERALEIDLVDVKVMAFSDVLSGLKLVIPVAKRAKPAKKKK